MRFPSFTNTEMASLPKSPGVWMGEEFRLQCRVNYVTRSHMAAAAAKRGAG